MIERVLLFMLFTVWIVSLMGTFVFSVTMDKYKNLEKYAIVCGIVAFVTTSIIVVMW